MARVNDRLFVNCSVSEIVSSEGSSLYGLQCIQLYQCKELSEPLQ